MNSITEQLLTKPSTNEIVTREHLEYELKNLAIKQNEEIEKKIANKRLKQKDAKELEEIKGQLKTSQTNEGLILTKQHELELKLTEIEKKMTQMSVQSNSYLDEGEVVHIPEESFEPSLGTESSSKRPRESTPTSERKLVFTSNNTQIVTGTSIKDLTITVATTEGEILLPVSRSTTAADVHAMLKQHLKLPSSSQLTLLLPQHRRIPDDPTRCIQNFGIKNAPHQLVLLPDKVNSGDGLILEYKGKGQNANILPESTRLSSHCATGTKFVFGRRPPGA